MCVCVCVCVCESPEGVCRVNEVNTQICTGTEEHGTEERKEKKIRGRKGRKEGKEGIEIRIDQ